MLAANIENYFSSLQIKWAIVDKMLISFWFFIILNPNFSGKFNNYLNLHKPCNCWIFRYL